MKNLIFIIIFFTGPSGFLYSQLYGPDADWSEEAGYPVINDGEDSLFVFNSPSYGEHKEAALLAFSPDSTAGWRFDWEKYNPGILDYVAFVSDTGMFSYIDTITVPGNYRVTIIKGEEKVQYAGWVFFNDFNVVIRSKDTLTGEVPLRYYTCDFLDLATEIIDKKQIYSIPGQDTSIVLSGSYRIRWSADPDTSPVPPGTLNPRISKPSAVSTDYMIKVTDRFGAERNDEVRYESIQSQAVFSEEHVPLENTEYYSEDVSNNYYFYSDEHSAPAIFLFSNTSINAVNYTWIFGDGEMYVTNDADEEVSHQYDYPGEYEVTLVSRSAVPYECIDSAKTTITVDPPKLKAPNVFTPNGDDINDVFRFYDVSVMDIHIIIFNRYGHKVHEFEGNIRDWPGWDGKINNTNNKASEGVYYYVVTRAFAIEDWETDKIFDFNEGLEDQQQQTDNGSQQDDDKKTEDKHGIYTGMIHLFRNGQY